MASTSRGQLLWLHLAEWCCPKIIVGWWRYSRCQVYTRSLFAVSNTKIRRATVKCFYTRFLRWRSRYQNIEETPHLRIPIATLRLRLRWFGGWNWCTGNSIWRTLTNFQDGWSHPRTRLPTTTYVSGSALSVTGIFRTLRVLREHALLSHESKSRLSKQLPVSLKTLYNMYSDWDGRDVCWIRKTDFFSEVA